MLDVGAREVQLHRSDAAVLGDPAAEVREVADRLRRHRDEDRDAEVERVEVLHETLYAWVLEPYGVDHAGRRLGDARRRVARPSNGGRGLGQYRPVDTPGLTERLLRQRPRRGNERCCERHPAQLDREVHARHPLPHYHARTSARKTGPSTQDRTYPPSTGTTQPLHDPFPQPIRSSTESCRSPSGPAAPLTAASMAFGPQA